MWWTHRFFIGGARATTADSAPSTTEVTAAAPPAESRMRVGAFATASQSIAWTTAPATRAQFSADHAAALGSRRFLALELFGFGLSGGGAPLPCLLPGGAAAVDGLELLSGGALLPR